MVFEKLILGAPHGHRVRSQRTELGRQLLLRHVKLQRLDHLPHFRGVHRARLILVELVKDLLQRRAIGDGLSRHRDASTLPIS